MKRSASYGRVSSDRQEQEDTIQSQLSELRARVREDGVVGCQEFADEGYSRDTLVRPGLDNLRDLASQSELDRLYVQCPDRLGSGAKLILLVEEFQHQGVEVVFLRGSVDETPEGKLMLHVQGAIAEYERTKIAERTRRGKLYWARQGAMVGGHAPFGYRFICRTETESAHLEVDENKASIVRQMFRWLVDEGLSTRAVAKRLSERGIPTARGAFQWQPTAVDRVFRNPVYKGEFVYCRHKMTMPGRRLTKDPYKQSRKTGREQMPQEDWIIIPVPKIVEESTWEQAQGQLQQNAVYARRNNKRHNYLLRSLIRCPRCGSTYSGFAQNEHRGYRCTNASPVSSSTGKKCPPDSIRAQPVEDAVWEAVTEALQQPQLLKEEYQRRMTRACTSDALDEERKQTKLALKQGKAQEDRITDAYINEAMELDRYKTEMEKLRVRRQELERARRDIERRGLEQQEGLKALEHLQKFCESVSVGLEAMTFEERQQLLRLVVERIIVEDHKVRIETVIPTGNDDEMRARHGEPFGRLRADSVEPSWCQNWPLGNCGLAKLVSEVGGTVPSCLSPFHSGRSSSTCCMLFLYSLKAARPCLVR